MQQNLNELILNVERNFSIWAKFLRQIHKTCSIVAGISPPKLSQISKRLDQEVQFYGPQEEVLPSLHGGDKMPWFFVSWLLKSASQLLKFCEPPFLSSTQRKL